MIEFYPPPPHLSVAIYPGLAEATCFASVCSTVETAGCEPNSLIEVVPWDRSFELRSDLADVATTLDVDAERRTTIVSGQSSVGRPVRAAYSHERFGRVVVEYTAAPPGDHHPIAVSLGAGALGMPVDLWRRGDRANADRLAGWAMKLLRDASYTCQAPYGSIGVEFSLATPSRLRAGESRISPETFISRTLVSSSAALAKALSVEFGDCEQQNWGHGVFLAGWEPFNSQKITVPRGSGEFRRSSIALGNALMSTTIK